MDEDRSKAEKIIKACEYLNTIISDPVEKACCKGLMERVKELEMEREIKCREILHFDSEEELECQKKHYMKPVERSHISNRYGNKKEINLLNAIMPRKLQVWEEECLCYMLPRATQLTLWRPHKSWIWLNLLMKEKFTKYTGIRYNNSIEPSEEFVLDSVIYWKHDHTDYLYDIKIDSICGFPLEMIKLPDPCEKRNLNDNKTQLERVVKRRK